MINSFKYAWNFLSKKNITFKYYSQVPNFLGAILGFIQVSLFYKYPRQSGLIPKATNLGGV
jgi:hypothetical protein